MIQIILFVVVLALFVATAIVTLLGVMGKVEVKGRYLGPLVAGLLLEVAASVMVMFSTINFDQETANDFIARLPPEVRADSSDSVVRSIEDLVTELATARSDTEVAQAEFADHFLVRLVEFHGDAAVFGGSLNITTPPDPRKADLARRLLEFLSEIDQYDGPLDVSAGEVKEALAAYQEARGLPGVSWYTSHTFNALVRDYINLGFAEEQPSADSSSVAG